MTKEKKVIICVLALAVVIAAVVLYLVFGVFGVQEKRTYQVSQTVSTNVSTGKTVLDDTVTYQSMNGFGASACWWSQDVGDWENTDEIMSYLYDSEKGIGLNIYRYNLGAGSKGDEHITLENRGAECFLQPDGTYAVTLAPGTMNAPWAGWRCRDGALLPGDKKTGAVSALSGRAAFLSPLVRGPCRSPTA